MKVVHVINTLGGGGAEKLIVDLAPYFLDSGIQLSVVVLVNNSKSTYIDTFRSLGVSIYVASTKKNVYNPVFLLELRKLLRGYEIIHVHLFPSQLWVALACLGRKVKLISTEHSATPNRQKYPMLRYLDRYYNHYYCKIACVSESVRSEFIKWIGGGIQTKCVCVDNGVNVESYKRALPHDRKSFKCGNSDILIVMTGRFNISKDQATLVHCLKFLPFHYKLVLLGEGEKEADIRKLAFVEELEDRVLFLGFRNDVSSILKMCDLFVLSSYYEGLPLSLIEAMAAGLPVIASRVLGTISVLDNEEQLFNVGQAEELAQKILNIDQPNVRTRLIQWSMDEITKYDIRRTASKYVELYKSILDN